LNRLVNQFGRVDYIIGTGIDISSHAAEEQRLGYEATHDPLTGLVNRRYLLRELSAAISRAQECGDPFCVAIADFDYFKHINDTYGHESGDAVLSYFAEILRRELSPRDLASRLGVTSSVF
jgi:diguanylate cyclase (GGDEF)-like protein